MANRLLLFDLDGTLLTSDQRVLRSTAEALRRCKDLHMAIGYITARSPRKVGLFLKDLPCDCIAYYNGATLYAEGCLLESHLIPYDVGIGILKGIADAHWNIRVGAYLEPYNFHNGMIVNMETGDQKQGGVSDLPRANMQRIRIVYGEGDDIQWSRFMTPETAFHATVDGTAIIVHKNANKESAMKRFAKWFQIPLANVIAFGDDINDLNMLKSAGIGVAMGNAVEPLKAAADYVTDTNDRDGLSAWVRKHLLGS